MAESRWDSNIPEHNQHQADEAKALADELGFESFVSKKTGRFVTANTEAKESTISKRS